MNIALLNKSDLSILNKRSLKYKLAGAEKIRATSDRARYRDFYDLVLLIEKFKFNLQEIKDLISQKETRNPITRASIAANWAVAKKEKERELGSIYYAGSVSDEAVATMIEKIKIEE